MLRQLVPALVVPLLLATGCATEADDAAVEVRTGPAAVAALRAVPDAAAAAGTAKFEVTTAMTVEGQAVELVATGAYDAETQRMSTSIDMGALYEQLAVESEEDLPSGLDGVMSIVADGPTLYLRYPGLELVMGSADWVSFGPNDHGMTAEDLGLASFDPSTLLESLRGVTGEPTVLGTEAVRGVETTRYTATVDVARALDQVPAADRAQIEALREQLGDAEVGVDVWVGDDGMPRRVRMDLGRLALVDFGGGTGAVLTMELFDYGQPVDIQVPAADQVTPFTELVGGSFGSDE